MPEPADRPLQLTVEQAALALAMAEISEASFRSTWLPNVEYLLWSAVTGNTDGMRWALREEDVLRLQRLSERCGGWIAREGESLCWLPAEGWERRYAAHQEQREVRIEGRLYSREEYEAELEARRNGLQEAWAREKKARLELAAASWELLAALGLAEVGGVVSAS